MEGRRGGKGREGRVEALGLFGYSVSPNATERCFFRAVSEAPGAPGKNAHLSVQSTGEFVPAAGDCGTWEVVWAEPGRAPTNSARGLLALREQGVQRVVQRLRQGDVLIQHCQWVADFWVCGYKPCCGGSDLQCLTVPARGIRPAVGYVTVGLVVRLTTGKVLDEAALEAASPQPRRISAATRFDSALTSVHCSCNPHTKFRTRTIHSVFERHCLGGQAQFLAACAGILT